MKQFTHMFLLIAVMSITGSVQAQGYWGYLNDRESTLGLEEGFLEFETPAFELKLVKSSQTVAALSPKSNLDFDFTPGDRLDLRDKDSLFHLGDINFRIKLADGSWKNYSTAYSREEVEVINPGGKILAAADLSNTLGADFPLSVNRIYETNEEGELVMRFDVSNTSSAPVEIGALGIPMIFNNILEGKSLDEAHAQNVFYDPYIGEDAGYLEVKRLDGKGKVLLVLPEENMNFQAYRPLREDLTRKSIVFEGFHEWMPLSKAYAEKEWEGVQQWNKPTSVVLEPGEEKSFALSFVLADQIREIEEKLIEEERPVAVGIPGYVLPQNVNAKLYLKYPHQVASMVVEPEGSLQLEEKGTNSAGYKEYQVNGKTWGRSRLTVNYENGLTQTIHYKVIKPESEVVNDFGHFLTTEQWFDKENDPFNRNPSVISYDYEEKKQVTEDSRAWIAGLSDEGGAASWLGAIMKQLLQPDPEEIDKLERFVNETLWGGIQVAEGEKKYGVKKSIFYYEPEKMPEGTYSDDINYDTWAAWSKKGADDLGRSYNYPHVAAAHWVMYRLARYHEGLVDDQPWDWYLKNAYNTAVAMTEFAPHYAQFGQMEGTVFLLILKDLKHEGLTELAADLEERMKKRADHWRSLNYPFGSEMPWDSTGQEEVYMWSDYFGFDEKEDVTLNAILAYMPTVPHWAYNGSARRYWDFLYAGKLSRVERQLHHYGSALNAIPVLKEYREDPDLYLLRVGYGGLLGGISNITKDGFGPAAFHSFPSTLEIDYLSGDYGSGFFGYAVNSGTYLANSEKFGWLAFGGNLTQSGKEIKVDITTAGKNRIYIEPRDLWLTLDAGTFKSVSYNTDTEEVEVVLNPRNEHTSAAFLRSSEDIDLKYEKVRDAYKIPLKKKELKLNL